MIYVADDSYLTISYLFSVIMRFENQTGGTFGRGENCQQGFIE